MQDKEEVITIAVASNFLTTAKKLKAIFEKQSNDKVKVISGSTGQLSHQIINGAPFDVFLSANKEHPERIKNTFNLSDSDFFQYAQGSLVLITRLPLTTLPSTSTNISDLLRGESSLDQLSSEIQNDIITQVVLNSGKLALANAKLAPYGRAAEDTLKNLNIYKQSQNKIIKGQNITQAYQFFTSGNVDTAFIAKSQWLSSSAQVKESKRGRIDINTSLHQPIEQWAVIINNSAASNAFKSFMVHPDTQAILKQDGYGSPL